MLEVLDVLEENIVLFQNCGQKAKDIVILPLKPFLPERAFKNVIGYDSINKSILYFSDAIDNEETAITVFNVESGEDATVTLKEICSAVNPIECIDDIRYEINKIHIYYYGKDDETIYSITIFLAGRPSMLSRNIPEAGAVSIDCSFPEDEQMRRPVMS